MNLEGKDKLVLTTEDANALLEKRGFGEKDLPDDEDERLSAGLQYGKDNISHRFKESVRDFILSPKVLSQKLSIRRVDAFLKACVQKYKAKRIEPGTAWVPSAPAIYRRARYANDAENLSLRRGGIDEYHFRCASN